MTIGSFRNKINELDDQILYLLNKRASYAAEIGKIKRSEGIQIYDPEREKQILERLASINPGPLDEKSIKTLFERIIDESRRFERKI